VSTGSGAPEVSELPSAWGYSWATQPHGDINSGDWSSRLGVRPAILPWETFLAAKCRTGMAGWTSQRRPLLRPRIMKTDLNVATWEVLSMLQARKSQEIADQSPKG
jgi:hypothetical protein